MSVASGAAGPHLREGGVARRVDERDRLTVAVDLIGADVLGDPARLAGDDVGGADLVEHGRLAVVDVAHHGDHRRAFLQQLLVVVVAVVEHRLELDFLLLARIDEQDVGAELEREQLHVVVGERHRGGDHLAVLEQELDDVGGGAVELGSELLGGDAALDHDRALGNRGVPGRVRLLMWLQLFAVAAATALGAVGWATLAARPAAGPATTGAAR